MLKQDSAIVGLINPKNVSNVGGVIRAAHCFGTSKVLYTGTRYDRATRFQTDPKKAAGTMSVQHTTDIFKLIPSGFYVVCIELAVGATALTQFSHPANAAYLFGPEDGTLSQDTIDRANSVVFIPSTSSLNLAAAVNVVLYDRQAKQLQIAGRGEYDQLIRNSRDCRNRLTVSECSPRTEIKDQ